MDSSSEDSTIAVGEVIFFAIRDKVELYGLVRVRQLARIVFVEGASLLLRAEVVVLSAEGTAMEMSSTAARLTRLWVNMKAGPVGSMDGYLIEQLLPHCSYSLPFFNDYTSSFTTR